MRVLISAGPTRERLDPVRFLSNRSSGKMGYALAAAAHGRGWETTLVSGPVELPCPAGVERVMVESAAEMAEAILSRAAAADCVIMAAAVADYRPRQAMSQKIKKGGGTLVLELERTQDILAELGKRKKSGQLLVGFAAETENLLSNAAEKLRKKNLDWIVANDVSKPDRGFGTSENCVTLLGVSGRRIELPLADKRLIAAQVLTVITGGEL